MTERGLWLSERLIDVRRTLDRRNESQVRFGSPTTKERAFSGTSPLPITQEGNCPVRFFLEWRSMRKAGFLYEDSNKKEKGKTISYWIIWLNEEELFMWSHFTTIWNARNFDWWKPVHEDYPFSYVQFPFFGKHPVSQQMNISLSLSCSLYVVWKLLQGSNE